MNMNEIGQAGAKALRVALAERSAKALMGVLEGMDGKTMASALTDLGFVIKDQAKAGGRNAIFQDVKNDLQEALKRGVDGHELRKTQRFELPKPGVHADTTVALNVVRDVFSSSKIRVIPLGPASISQRPALQMVAAQAMLKGVMGFAIDGVGGKYDLPASLPEVVELHGAAARAFAHISTVQALQKWAKGSPLPAKEMSDWVPDSVQRVLQGSVSVSAAERVTSALSSDVVGQYAEDQGRAIGTALLAEKGFDISAPSAEQQAVDQGLTVKKPDLGRGQYFGTVVGQDHRVCLVKISRSEALLIPVSEMGGDRPAIGSSLRIGFKSGTMNVSMKAPGRAGLGR